MLNRRRFTAAAAMAAPLACTRSFAQGQFPSKPLTIIVPLSAGGPTDVLVRSIGNEMSTDLGVPVVIDNRPGGNFNIGLRALASAPPDGHTIGIGFSTTHSINPHLFNNLQYKVADFQSVSLISRGHHMLAVSAKSPFTTLAELIADAKRRGAPMLVGVTSIGGSPHLVAEEIASRHGLKVEAVVYKGGAPAVQELVAGNLPLLSEVLPTVYPFVKSGDVRVLAVSSAKRVTELPNVPTLAELGFTGMDWKYWTALYAPARTPPDVVARLNAAVNKAVRRPGVVDRLQPDQEAVGSTPGELDELIRSDSARWGEIIRARKITVSS